MVNLLTRNNAGISVLWTSGCSKGLRGKDFAVLGQFCAKIIP